MQLTNTYFPILSFPSGDEQDSLNDNANEREKHYAQRRQLKAQYL